MKILKRLVRRVVKVGIVSESDVDKPVDFTEFALSPGILGSILTPDDLIAYPERAVEAAISKGISQGGRDPLCLLKELLESLDMEFNPRWEMVARAGMIQYRMGEFTKRIYEIDPHALTQNIPVNTISYRVCIERTLEELHDELMQINGLLDGMGASEEETLSPIDHEATIKELKRQIGPLNVRIVEDFIKAKREDKDDGSA